MGHLKPLCHRGMADAETELGIKAFRRVVVPKYVKLNYLRSMLPGIVFDLHHCPACIAPSSIRCVNEYFKKECHPGMVVNFYPYTANVIILVHSVNRKEVMCWRPLSLWQNFLKHGGGVLQRHRW